MLESLTRLFRNRRRVAYVVAPLAVLALVYVFFFASPLGYPPGAIVHVNDGESVSEVAEMLHAKGFVQSPIIFKALVRLWGDSGVRAGSYAVSKENVITLSYRFVNGVSGLEPQRVTIPEGSTVRDIAETLKTALQDFDDVGFIAAAKSKEGYLFPDTYFFLPGVPPELVIKTLSANYEAQVGPLRAEIIESGHSEVAIITMASLLQNEARKPETMKTISGILWKRIDVGMPLQVDAVFGYIFGKDTYSPSLDDLKVDSPYNVYTHKGLPPGPIGNPGIDAIIAALRPTKTPYLYYLTGKDGFMYYAKTFAEHVANKVHLR